MNRLWALRLTLDVGSLLLLISGLAYWWSGNRLHEWIGLAFFTLVLVHNGFNRRWYGRLKSTVKHPRGRLTVVLNALFLSSLLILLATSFVVSRDVFAFLPFSAGITSRELHLVSAYWALILLGLHLGLNWPIVRGLLRFNLSLKVPAPLSLAAKTFGFIGVLLLGVNSAIVLGIGPKLINQVSLTMWDFNTQRVSFYLHWLAVLGSLAVVGATLANTQVIRHRRKLQGLHKRDQSESA